MTETVGLQWVAFPTINHNKIKTRLTKTDQSQGFSHCIVIIQVACAHAGSLARGSANEVNAAFLTKDNRPY